MKERRDTYNVNVGGVVIGSSEPVRIQSMTNTPTEDSLATANQIKELTDAGSELVRVTVNNEISAENIINAIMGGTLGLKAWFDPTTSESHKAKQTLLVRLLYQVATSRAPISSKFVIANDHATKLPAPEPLPGPTGISLLLAQFTKSDTIKKYPA